MTNHLDYIESLEHEVRLSEGLRRYVALHPVLGHYCGCAVLRQRPALEPGYDGILTYVPVHGGITYAEELADGRMIYGFDCAHANDELNPQYQDVEWLFAEIDRMVTGVQLAAEYEPDYLAAPDASARAVILDRYHSALSLKGITFDLSDNFGAMIQRLFGELTEAEGNNAS